MARIFLSPLIVDIRAKQSDTVFSKWRGINYIRSRVIPANPKTAAQTAVRQALARLVSLWQNGHYSLRINRSGYATGLPKSGFNTFIGDNLVDEKNGNLLDLTKDLGFNKLSSFSASTGTGSGEINVSWSPSVPADSWIVLCVRKEGANNWAKIQLATGTSMTITGLEAGATYQVYGYFMKNKSADELKADEVGDDMSDTATAGS